MNTELKEKQIKRRQDWMTHLFIQHNRFFNFYPKDKSYLDLLDHNINILIDKGVEISVYIK